MEEQINGSNCLDDIFGSSPDRHTSIHPANHIESTPSDVPSLRRQHVTAGYRDGIAMAKSQCIQAGFDGGYPVGAQLGLRVGTILGILEGVTSTSSSKGKGPVRKQWLSSIDSERVRGDRERFDRIRELCDRARLPPISDARMYKCCCVPPLSKQTNRGSGSFCSLHQSTSENG